MGSMQGFTRLFTVEEANALIPGLRPVVEELLGTFREIRAEIEEAAGQAKLPLGSPELGKHLEERAVFPRLFDNEIVFLCWKYGEPGIGYWHRIPDGFAGRQPLLDLSSPEEGARVH